MAFYVDDECPEQIKEKFKREYYNFRNENGVVLYESKFTWKPAFDWMQQNDMEFLLVRCSSFYTHGYGFVDLSTFMRFLHVVDRRQSRRWRLKFRWFTHMRWYMQKITWEMEKYLWRERFCLLQGLGMVEDLETEVMWILGIV